MDCVSGKTHNSRSKDENQIKRSPMSLLAAIKNGSVHKVKALLARQQNPKHERDWKEMMYDLFHQSGTDKQPDEDLLTILEATLEQPSLEIFDLVMISIKRRGLLQFEEFPELIFSARTPVSLRWLLQSGADANALQLRSGNTILGHWISKYANADSPAIISSARASIWVLINYGANPNNELLWNREFRHFISFVIERCDGFLTDKMISHGADVHGSVMSGTLIDFAIKRRKVFSSPHQMVGYDCGFQLYCQGAKSVSPDNISIVKLYKRVYLETRNRVLYQLRSVTLPSISIVICDYILLQSS